MIMDSEADDFLPERWLVFEEIVLGELDIAAGNHVAWEEVKAGLQRWRC